MSTVWQAVLVGGLPLLCLVIGVFMDHRYGQGKWWK